MSFLSQLNAQMSDGNHHEDEEEGSLSSSLITSVKKETKKPALYRVVIHNDNYTPMEFVVLILRKFFGKDDSSAMALMLKVHNEGQAICGLYPYEIAETKVSQVIKSAMENEYPLKCTLERDT